LPLRQILIRDAVPGNLAAITMIYRHAVLHGTGTFELDPPEEVEMAARHARLTALGYPYLVACVAGEVLGYAYRGSAGLPVPGGGFDLCSREVLSQGAFIALIPETVRKVLNAMKPSRNAREPIAGMSKRSPDGSIRTPGSRDRPRPSRRRASGALLRMRANGLI